MPRPLAAGRMSLCKTNRSDCSKIRASARIGSKDSSEGLSSASEIGSPSSQVRITNHLERLFREFRTKSDEIVAFPKVLKTPILISYSRAICSASCCDGFPVFQLDLNLPPVFR